MKLAGATNKRLHHRHEIECPVTVFGSGGQVLTKTRSLNISNGGTLIIVPLKAVYPVGYRLNISLTVPSSKDFYEGYATSARVIHHEAMEDNFIVGMGLQFETELQLSTV